MRQRIPALDWMRGIVMILMATDHASGAYNADRLVTDSPFLNSPEIELTVLQFFNRWVSHLCAPSFLFLAGAALALSIERKVSRGAGAGRIDRDLLIRGLIIVAVDLLFINWFWDPDYLLLQVMYAIGVSMLIMIPARRLPTAWLVALAVALLVGSEFLLPSSIQESGGWLAVANRLLAGGGIVGEVLIAYPVLPWWAMMALGWGFGRYLLDACETTGNRRSPARLMLVVGTASLVAFVIVRGLNGFGNMQVLRVDGSWIQWLHVSKYPPSLTFATLELGLMALVLATLFRLQGSGDGVIADRNPVLVFGQTAFFFYLAHIFLLEVSARALAMQQQRGLVTSWVATAVALVVLYPLCLWYRKAKAARPNSLLKFF